MRKSSMIFCTLMLCAGCGFEDRVPIEMTSMSRTQPLGSETALDTNIRLDIGSLEITGSQKPDALYSFDLEYDKASYSPNIAYSPAQAGEGKLLFDLHSMHKRGVRRERFNNKLHLSFSESVPLALNINSGVGESRLSLSGLKLSSLSFEAGVGGAKMSVYEPNGIPCEFVKVKNGVGGFDATGLGNLNFKEFDFEGGVGGANLDFTGDWRQNAEVRIKLGVGGVNVRLPRGIGVKVEAEKSFLSGLHLEGFSQRDDYHYSEDYDSAPVKVSIRVESGVGGLRISWL